MNEIKILQKNIVVTIVSGKGNTLLKDLQENGFDVYSPCGGNGTCGKCKVYVKGEGDVTSCIYPVTNDIEIVLPEKREAKILVEQHEHTVLVPFNLGASTDLSYFPHGVAIDIGTTTLVFYLVNLITGGIIETRAVVNPQTKYGADVIRESIILQLLPVDYKHFRKNYWTRLICNLDILLNLQKYPAMNW